jgi:hypothetical protein
MDPESEVAEFRPHVKTLEVDGPRIAITTLEDITISAELTTVGL